MNDKAKVAEKVAVDAATEAVEDVKADASSVSGEVQMQEKPETAAPVTVGKKTKTSTNLIADVATEVESLTKTKALNLAANLAENIETNYFKLGGVLKVIYEQTWFEGYESFGQFTYDNFGFQERKAKYLMEIYSELVTKQIPWEKVGGLGWTKLKDLARVLTLENVDEWVAKASGITVTELQALLKAAQPAEEGATAKTTNDVQTLKFKLKNDQIETVNSALSKCKAEANTEYDTVALEMICSGYLGGSVSIPPTTSIDDQMKALGWKETLEKFTVLFPEVDLTVQLPEEA